MGIIIPGGLLAFIDSSTPTSMLLSTWYFETLFAIVNVCFKVWFDLRVYLQDICSDISILWAVISKISPSVLH